MRLIALVIAGFSLVACATEPPAPVAAAAAPGEPGLYDATPEGGKVSNADAAFAEQATGLASAHCRSFNKSMLVTGITAERRSIIFECIMIDQVDSAEGS